MRHYGKMFWTAERSTFFFTAVTDPNSGQALGGRCKLNFGKGL